MRRTALIILLPLLLACGGGDESESDVFALEERVDQIAASASLWPGFDPLRYPLAVYDGTDTYLFRHPEAPADFTQRGQALVFPGRHPAIVAHSSTMIGQAATATLLLDEPIAADALTDLAVVVLHESFHVFQGTTGRNWGADETQLFLYPVDDAELLALYRLETEALQRALATTDAARTAGWAQVALALRQERFARLEPGFVAYERNIEAHEGTAYYVECRAAGRSRPEFPPGGFPVEAVRRRAYETGLAWAFLLDKFRPPWPEGFGQDDQRYLDSDLAEALQGLQRPADCEFSEQERNAALASAREDIGELRAARTAMQDRFVSAPGWRLVIESDPEAPLWPRGFDPMNIRRLDTGLLHTRFLKLGNDAGTLEVMGDSVLTEGSGSHPMYNGIRRATIAGLATEPEFAADADTLSLVLPTLKARFTAPEIERVDQTIILRLRDSGS